MQVGMLQATYTWMAGIQPHTVSHFVSVSHLYNVSPIFESKPTLTVHRLSAKLIILNIQTQSKSIAVIA